MPKNEPRQPIQESLAGFKDDSARAVAELESNVVTRSLAAKKLQREAGGKFLVRVTSIRKKLLDEDNLCEKYHVDLLRYIGCLPCDSPDKCKIEVCQTKAAKGERERTIIEVFKIITT